MSQSKFDPSRYKNKKTIYVKIQNTPGVYSIWDWSKRLNKYVKRNSGLRFYSVKRVYGNQETKCFMSLKDAKLWRYEDPDFNSTEQQLLLFKVLTKKFLIKKKPDVRLSTYETLESKIKHLAFFNSLHVEQITPRVIDSWIDSIKQPKYLAIQHKSRLTYRHELSALKQILDHYSEYICENSSYSSPIKKRHKKDCVVDRQKYELSKAKIKRKFLPRAVLNAFLKSLKGMIPKNSKYSLYYQIAFFQIGTGARIGEVCALDWNDVDLDLKSAYIHRTVCWSRKKGRETYISPQTKTGESREIFFPDAVANELRSWSLATGRRKGLIFSFDGFKPIMYRTIQSIYDKALKEIGSEYRGTHIMRHSFSTDFLERTQNAKALQAQLGHQNAEQTNHYAKITSSLKRRGMDDYNDSFEEPGKVLKIETVRKC